MPNTTVFQSGQFSSEFQRLSPEAQTYIQQLEQESNILRILDLQNGYDFLEVQSLAFVSYLSKEDAPTGKMLETVQNVFQCTLYLTRKAVEMYSTELQANRN